MNWNDRDWVGMAGKGWEWRRMGGNVLERLGKAGTGGYCLGMVSNGFK